MKTIRIKGNDYQLNWVTGNVLESSKNMETKVSGGGGSYNSYQGTGGGRVAPIVSTTTVHDQFFISDNTGKEHSFQLQNFDLACRPGNKLSVIWLIKNGQQSGPYVAVINHSTSDKFISVPTLTKLYYPVNKILLNVLFVISVFVLLLPGFWIHPLLFLFILFMAWVVYMERKTKSNVRKFKDNLQPDEFN